MKKMMFLSKHWYFSVQKAFIYYTFNKSHHNSFILLVFSHVANFRYVANFRFLTLTEKNSLRDDHYYQGPCGSLTCFLDRTKWQRITTLSCYLSHYIPACSPVPEIKFRCSVFMNECATHYATVEVHCLV